jgi:7-cyano-7-deazaguanine reductase
MGNAKSDDAIWKDGRGGNHGEIFDDLMAAYEPDRLRIVMVFNPRGGISSKLTIDSDWKTRGGDEKYKDWVGLGEEW